VSDTLRALGEVARFWRNRFALPIIAVTGSNGKTSTKEIIAHLLEECYRVLKNPGNLNNLVGLPLTLLDLKPSHEVAVVEMGTNMPGEIRRLTEIARPTIGIITNIGEAHLEGMGSLEVLIREKGELFRGIEQTGILVVNQNDPHVVDLAKGSGGRKIRFGVNTEADVMINRVEWRGSQGTRFQLVVGKNKVSVDLPLVGIQLIHNIAAAVAAVSIFEMPLADIQTRLERFKPMPMRMEIILLRGLKIINDAYNANPPSVGMALRTLSRLKGRKRAFVVLGDMLELGEASHEAHRTVGRLIEGLKIAGLFLLGEYAKDVADGAMEQGMNHRKVWITEGHQEIASLLKRQAQPGDWVLVKGSRRMRMENVIKILQEEG
jgi:UDP-N-acetylmuramoyl-tripeptide--D-alanyl-D-alanine ligase